MSQKTINIPSHTSGPWVAGKNNLAVNFRFVTDRGGDVVAYCDKPKGEARANARLIAAAPELLAELVASVERLEELRDRHLLHAAAVTRALVQKRIDAARVAIAKATGEDSRQ